MRPRFTHPALDGLALVRASRRLLARIGMVAWAIHYVAALATRQARVDLRCQNPIGRALPELSDRRLGLRAEQLRPRSHRRGAANMPGQSGDRAADSRVRDRESRAERLHPREQANGEHWREKHQRLPDLAKSLWEVARSTRTPSPNARVVTVATGCTPKRSATAGVISPSSA